MNRRTTHLSGSSIFERKRQAETAFFGASMSMTDIHSQSGYVTTVARRSKSVAVEMDKKCSRCGRSSGLQRDHIVPIHIGGKDETRNLQYLCTICHRYKTTQDRLFEELRWQSGKRRRSRWRVKMLDFRLRTHARLNPAGAERYRSYWEEEDTHVGAWMPSICDLELGRPTKIDDFMQGKPTIESPGVRCSGQTYFDI